MFKARMPNTLPRVRSSESSPARMLIRVMLIPAQKYHRAEAAVSAQMFLTCPISHRAGIPTSPPAMISAFLCRSLSDSQPALTVPTARAT